MADGSFASGLIAPRPCTYAQLEEVALPSWPDIFTLPG
jgi:hypothetical protein